jgi:predicted dehydrogenase
MAAAVCPGAVAFTDEEQIIASIAVDAVVVACPPQVHYRVARQALSRGIHTFLEKPPTVTRRELSELSRLAKDKGLVTMVGHNLRHSMASSVVHDLISQKDFGRPVFVGVQYLVSQPKGKRWRLRSVLQSFLLSHAIHAIDMLIFQFGRVAKVPGASFRANSFGEILLAQLIFQSGALGSLVVSSGAPRFEIEVTALSDKGRLARMQSLRRVIVQGAKTNSSRWEQVWTPRTLDCGYESAGYQCELALFIEAVRSQKSAAPSFEDELAVYDVIDGILRQV